MKTSVIMARVLFQLWLTKVFHNIITRTSTRNDSILPAHHQLTIVNTVTSAASQFLGRIQAKNSIRPWEVYGIVYTVCHGTPYSFAETFAGISRDLVHLICLFLGCLTPECGSLLVGCLTSQQHASVSQGRICSDIFTCCHTEIEVADQTFYLTQSQYTDTGPTSPSADPITPGAWQGSHWSANY